MSSKQWHGGKGSQRRGDDSKSNELYQSNWDRIFGGIDYADKDLKQSLYHSSEEAVGLSPGKNIPAISGHTVLKSDNTVITINKSFNNNGENK